jgi:hypothetical protein
VKSIYKLFGKWFHAISLTTDYTDFHEKNYCGDDVGPGKGEREGEGRGEGIGKGEGVGADFHTTFLLLFFIPPGIL